jgi:hypothetical protein
MLWPPLSATTGAFDEIRPNNHFGIEHRRDAVVRVGLRIE